MDTKNVVRSGFRIWLIKRYGQEEKLDMPYAPRRIRFPKVMSGDGPLHDPSRHLIPTITSTTLPVSRWRWTICPKGIDLYETSG